MKSISVLLATAAIAFAGSAIAQESTCAAELKRLDEAAKTARLDAAKSADMQKLRAESEKLCKDGKNDASLQAISQARAMIGLKAPSQ